MVEVGTQAVQSQVQAPPDLLTGTQSYIAELHCNVAQRWVLLVGSANKFRGQHARLMGADAGTLANSDITSVYDSGR